MNAFRKIFSLVDLKQWANDHQPAQCSVCRSWQFEKDIIRERSFTGHILPICKPCHDELYEPFSEASDEKS